MNMDWHPLVGTLGGLLALIAIFPYVKDILRGTTRPNIVSYSIWALLLLIALAAQISAGASWSVILLIGDFIGTSTAIVLCLIGYGYKKYGWVEWVCLSLAIIAIVSWQLTKQPVLAIVFALIADAMAATPTLIKSFKDPWSEYPVAWLIAACGAFLGVASTTIFNVANLLFPIYLLVINAAIGLTALIGRHFKLRRAG